MKVMKNKIRYKVYYKQGEHYFNKFFYSLAEAEKYLLNVNGVLIKQSGNNKDGYSNV